MTRGWSAMKTKIFAMVACALVGFFIACLVFDIGHPQKKSDQKAVAATVTRLNQVGCVLAGCVAVAISWLFQRGKLHPTVAINMTAAQIMYLATIPYGLKGFQSAGEDVLEILDACKFLLMQFIS